MIEPRLIGKAMFSCVSEQIILSSLELGSENWVVSAINQGEGTRPFWIFIQASNQKDMPSNEERFDN